MYADMENFNSLTQANLFHPMFTQKPITGAKIMHLISFLLAYLPSTLFDIQKYTLYEPFLPHFNKKLFLYQQNYAKKLCKIVTACTFYQITKILH